MWPSRSAPWSKKRVLFRECKSYKILAVLLLLTFSIFFSSFVRAELDLKVNAQLDGSNNFDSDFYLQTDSAATNGIDYLDFELQSFPSGNYSFLTSTVSGKNLIVDVFPSSNRTIYLVYRVNPSLTGSLSLSWVSSVFGYPYDAVLTDYGSDSSYTTSVDSKNMKTSSSYSVSHTGAARYFSLGINYFNFSCGDGTCNGASRGEDCSSCAADCGACSSGETGGNTGGGGGTVTPVCEDSSWDVVSTGSCSYGQRPVNQVSNCGDTRTIYESCCNAEIITGDWSECTPQNTRTRNVKQTSESCQVVDSIETGSCTYQCSESWSCDWGSCQNGFISPRNCIERNNCGTEDNKPQPIPCSQENNMTQVLISGLNENEQSFLSASLNCSINFVCDEWSGCEVKTGMEDVKNAQGNLDGAKYRKCVDSNGCITSPYYEQQRCSLKLYITPKKENICGQDYLSIYEQGTDYLLARIKDDRQTRGSFSIQFVLGGRAEAFSCEPKVTKEYKYTSLEKIMSYTNIRKLWGLLR